MHFNDVYKELAAKKYYIFSSEDLNAFFPKDKRATLKQQLFRWKKSGRVSSLRKNLYELTFPGPHDVPDLFLANKIYAPSYVSLETALSHYSMIPEVAMAVTSITTKATRRFNNSHGLFTYQSVQEKAFCGYTIESHNGFDVLIAEPEKALVDYLYFKKEIERLDRTKMARLNGKKLKVYAAIYGIDMKKALYDHL